MDSPLTRLALIPLTQRFSRVPWLTGSVLVLALGLSACGKRDNSDPSGTTAPGPSTEVEVRTPVAPDSRGGGSSGPKGSVPTADTSGGPSSDASIPGASSSSSAPGAASSGAKSGTGNTGR